MRKAMVNDVKARLLAGVDFARRAGASAARISFMHGEATDCSFESGRLKDTGSHESYSYAIDVIRNGRRGGAVGNRLDRLDEMIDRALTLSTTGSAAHFETFPAPGPMTRVRTHSDNTLRLTREDMIDGCARIADALRSYNDQLFISCGADRNEAESLLVTSGGVCHASTYTAWSLGATAQRTEGSDILFSSYGRSWSDLNEFYDPQLIADRILTELRRSEKLVPAPSGRLKAFLPADAIGILLAPVGMGINGRNVVKGNSPLKGKLGRRVLADSITIIDNPHVDFSPGAAEIDGSGIPTRRQPLFENGVLQRFLYDLDTAGLAGVEPTGNNGCGAYWPVFTPGRRKKEELLADIADGIYIHDLIGFGQGNLINGDFSCLLGLGYRVQNGEITGRIKDTMIAGNIYDLFSKNVELSSDLNHEKRLPNALIEGLSVTGR